MRVCGVLISSIVYHFLLGYWGLLVTIKSQINFYLFYLFSQVLKLPVPVYPVCDVVAESVAHHTFTVIFCHVVFLAEL